MNTEQFIQTLSADSQMEQRVDRSLVIALVVSGLITGGLFLALFGIRPDIGTAITRPDVLLKQVFPWVVALAGLRIVVRLSRPGAKAGAWIWPLLAVPVAILLAIGQEMMLISPELWARTAMGHSAMICLSTIPLLALPIAAVCFWVLRDGAATRPALCGAFAGLMSGGAAAAMYAFFCTDDSPMFFGIWYVAGIGIVTLAGAVAGKKFLKW